MAADIFVAAPNCTVIGHLPDIYIPLVAAFFLFLSRDPRV